ncbi:MAG: class I SAM-dependent methyltransferase [Bacillota bacterium]|nr:class I SAM-dependent methyltransferase [Bacillota bacterium]MDP4160239.1 class I SAM-dependent methyltransferase [Bacillota bacterium]
MGLSGNEDFIINLARLVRPKVFVKLGLYQCTLFNKITPYAEKSIGVDIQPEVGEYMKQSRDTHFINGTTQEFVKQLETKPLQINMLLFDGENIKEAGPQDFHRFFPFIAPQGFILLQDPRPDKTQMIKPGLYDLMKIPDSPGLTICRKRIGSIDEFRTSRAG